mgnify:CR=1 FL=1
MANFVSIFRIFIALLAVYLLFVNATWAYLTAFVLTIVAFAFDGLDGYLARKLHEESELGAVLDIMGDRIVENAYWIAFAVLGYLADGNLALNALFPIICITRAFTVDSIRSVALSKGFTAFGEKTMQSSKIGKFICASRFMRISYAVAKVMAFIVLIIANTPAFEGSEWAYLLNLTGIILAWIAIIFCVVRGLPVVFEAKSVLEVK